MATTNLSSWSFQLLVVRYSANQRLEALLRRQLPSRDFASALTRALDHGMIRYGGRYLIVHHLDACLNAGSTGNSEFACLRNPIIDVTACR
jgi:hypothetical protein